jgi:hypothetical protein
MNVQFFFTKMLDINSLTNSSRTRSAEIIEMRDAIDCIAEITESSMLKLSWPANLAARIMRSGSSENDCSALAGL